MLALILSLLFGCAALGLLCCCVVVGCGSCTSTAGITYKVVFGGTAGGGVGIGGCTSGNCAQLIGTYFLTRYSTSGNTPPTYCCWSVSPSWTGCLTGRTITLGCGPGLLATCNVFLVHNVVTAGECNFNSNGDSNYWDSPDGDCGNWTNTSFAADTFLGNQPCDITSVTCLVTKQ